MSPYEQGMKAKQNGQDEHPHRVDSLLPGGAIAQREQQCRMHTPAQTAIPSST